MSTTFEASRRRTVRLLVAGVLAATCARVWLDPGEVVPRASAQIPDAGLQRRELVEEVRRSNRLLEQVLHTLKSETIQVRLDGTDNTSDKVVSPRPKKP